MEPKHTMAITRKLGVLTAATVLSFSAACSTDLDISNPNNPDVERVLSSPEDVVALANGSMNSWWLTSTFYEPTVMSSVTADILTMNYGNFGARFNNTEPRIPYNNNSAAGDGTVASSPWNDNYSTLGAANDALRAFAGGIALEGNAEGTEAAKHIAMFVQAASLTNLALWFDQAFVVDETTDPQAALPELVPHAEVATAALAKWDALIAATAGKNHTYDPEVIPLIGGFNSARLNRMANTMAALLLAYMPRNSTEAAAVDWAKVAAYADKGIGTGSAGAPFDFTIMSDNDRWYSQFLLYANYPSWMRVDMRVINMIDPTQPARYAGVVPPKATGDDRLETDFRYFGSATERAEIGYPARDTVLGDAARGIYMMSPYQHKRWEHHAWHFDSYATGPTPFLLAAESDLVRAEALVRTNTSLATAAELINKTRVTRGGLTPLTGAEGSAALLAAINYERRIETIATNGWDMQRGRQSGWLQEGTARHLPVPASELEIQGLPIYTFGGVGKEQ